MKKTNSFIEQFSFKYIVAICLFIIVPEIYNLIKLILAKSFYSPRYANMWFDFSIGLILILMVALKLKYREEKIAVISFGVALISKSLQNIIGYQVSLSLVSAFEIIGIYFFRLTYKIYKQKLLKPINLWSKAASIKLLIYLIILLLPAILFWFLGEFWGHSGNSGDIILNSP